MSHIPKFNLPPHAGGPIPEGQPMQIKRENTKSMSCKCGGKYFLPVIAFRSCPGLANPTGKDIILTEQGLMCVSCRTCYSGPEGLQTKWEVKQ